MGIATVIAGIIAAATTVVSGIAGGAATERANQMGLSMEQQRLDTEDERFEKTYKMERSKLGMQKQQLGMQNQQYWTARADGLKQLGKKQFDKFAGNLLKRGGEDIMFKQALYSTWQK